MTKKYQAIAFALDGDYITEGNFETIDQAWERINDWGSRWVFYPLTGVVKNKRVVSFCDILPSLSNKDIKTVQKKIIKYQDTILHMLQN